MHSPFPPFARLFSRKESLLTSGLLSGATDIHSHILPGADDGLQNYQEAVDTLQSLHSTGIRQLFLTPHIMSDLPDNTTYHLSEKFNRFTKQLENDGITNIPALKLGAEYMLEPAFNIRKEEGLLTFAGRHVLVETSYLTPPLGLDDFLDDLSDHAYIPILAHPERYNYMDINDYEAFKTKKIKFQLNYLSLFGVYGKQVKTKAEHLLKESFYDFTGSDLHNFSFHHHWITQKNLKKRHIHQLHPLFQNNRHLW